MNTLIKCNNKRCSENNGGYCAMKKIEISDYGECLNQDGLEED